MALSTLLGACSTHRQDFLVPSFDGLEVVFRSDPSVLASGEFSFPLSWRPADAAVSRCPGFACLLIGRSVRSWRFSGSFEQRAHRAGLGGVLAGSVWPRFAGKMARGVRVCAGGGPGIGRVHFGILTMTSPTVPTVAAAVAVRMYPLPRRVFRLRHGKAPRRSSNCLFSPPSHSAVPEGGLQVYGGGERG